jgi:hypothetical protein
MVSIQKLGRLQLLQQLNNFLETDYQKLEHLKDGIAFCQIIDATYPGTVQLEKLNCTFSCFTRFFFYAVKNIYLCYCASIFLLSMTSQSQKRRGKPAESEGA